MYNLLQSMSPSGLTQLAYPPALYSPAGNENPAVSLMQQLQQGQQSGMLLGPAGLAGLTPQQQHQLAGAAGSNIYSSSSTAAYQLSKPSFMQQAVFTATGPTALVGATGSTQLPTAATGAGLASTAAAAAAGAATPSGSQALSILPLQAAAANTQSQMLYNFPQHLQQVHLLEQQQPQHQQLLLGYGGGAQQPQQQQQQPWQPRRQLQQQQPQSQQPQSVLLERYQQQPFGSQSGLQQHLPWLQSQSQQQNPVLVQQGQGQGQLLYEHAGRQQQQQLLQQADVLSKAPPSQQVLHKLGHWPDQQRELQQEMTQPQPQPQPQSQPQQSQKPQQQQQQQHTQTTASQHQPWQWVQQQTQQQLPSQQQQQQQQVQQQPRQSSQQQPQEAFPQQDMPTTTTRAAQQAPKQLAAAAALQQAAAAARQPNTQNSQTNTNEVTTGGAHPVASASSPTALTTTATISPAAGAAAAVTATTVATAAAAAAGAAAGGSRGAAIAPPLKPSPLPPPSTNSTTTSFRAVIDWKATFAATVAPYEVLPPGHPAKGLAGLEELRLGALEVLLVDAPEAANAAIEVLRSRMWDGIVAMDMEWKPDTAHGESHPVAVLQLSSAGLVVVVRTLACGLPDAFRTGFMEDSDVELVVAAWTSNDERKFEESFGQPTFWCKITDIQKVAKACGHSKTGVRALVQAVLEPSVGMPKSKRVTMSDWSATKLQPDQLKYAILDAACTEHVFRCLESRF
ncbi:hypothetical protein Vretimale_5407 [Volvox reticuliferus]|uniref:Uncharacterized protein n=1 Tax=Volvox reticuliferus TaxID=1737510 RepID=A0A8J4FF49_9CHLO|nr:hypothetical protein Vretifemale_3835 [Volvox reticuliferus]GIM00261.1 hypothetical protein Vretimale_5407 [Volvox reticuliferus]